MNFIRIISVFLGFLLILTALSSADPGNQDSIILATVSIEKGDPAIVELWTLTDEWLTGIEITLTWDWDNMVADSFKFTPGRLPSLVIQGGLPDEKILTIFAFPSGEDLISPGRLQLGTIYFNYPDTAQTRTVVIDTTTLYLSDSLIIRSNLFSDTIWPEPFTPQFKAGVVVMNVCCLGFTGNTNCDLDELIDLADITKLIDRVYLTKVPLCCEAAGNVNGDIESLLDLADITALIDHVYVSKGPTSACQ